MCARSTRNVSCHVQVSTSASGWGRNAHVGHVNSSFSRDPVQAHSTARMHGAATSRNKKDNPWWSSFLGLDQDSQKALAASMLFCFGRFLSPSSQTFIMAWALIVAGAMAVAGSAHAPDTGYQFTITNSTLCKTFCNACFRVLRTQSVLMLLMTPSSCAWLETNKGSRDAYPTVSLAHWHIHVTPCLFLNFCVQATGCVIWACVFGSCLPPGARWLLASRIASMIHGSDKAA